MPRPPITNKPLPQTPHEWYPEVNGIWECLKRLNRLRDKMGAKWVKGQRRYFTHRLCDLVDNKPRNCHVPRGVATWRKKQDV